MRSGQRDLGMLIVLVGSAFLTAIGFLMAYSQRSIWLGFGVLIVVFILLSSAKYFFQGAKA